MNQEPNEVNVSLKWAAPATTLCFIFTNLSFMFWLANTGYFGEGAGLILGLCQIGFFPAYIIGGVLLIKENDGWNGNIFMIFATFFGATAGITSAASYLLTVLNVTYDITPTNVCWILCGVLLIGSLPGIRDWPWTYFMIFFLAGVALILMGLGGFGILGAWSIPASGWVFLPVGILGIYCAIAGMNEHAGSPMPLGRPLFKK